MFKSFYLIMALQRAVSCVHLDLSPLGERVSQSSESGSRLRVQVILVSNYVPGLSSSVRIIELSLASFRRAFRLPDPRLEVELSAFFQCTVRQLREPVDSTDLLIDSGPIGEYVARLYHLLDSLRPLYQSVSMHCSSTLAQAQCYSATQPADFFFLLEHDWVFLRSRISHSMHDLVEELARGYVESIRFNKRMNVARGTDSPCLIPSRYATLPLLWSGGYSNNPHLVTKKLYMQWFGKERCAQAGTKSGWKWEVSLRLTCKPNGFALQNCGRLNSSPFPLCPTFVYGNLEMAPACLHFDGRRVMNNSWAKRGLFFGKHRDSTLAFLEGVLSAEEFLGYLDYHER